MSGSPAQLLLFGECAPEVPSELPAAAQCRGSVLFVFQDMRVSDLLPLCFVWFVFFYCRKTSCSSVTNIESVALPNHPAIQIWFGSKCLSVKWATSPSTGFVSCWCSYYGFVPDAAGLVISDLSENMLAKSWSINIFEQIQTNSVEFIAYQCFRSCDHDLFHLIARP